MKKQQITAGGLSVRQIGAVAAGNALEFYDFLTFSFFATQIGDVFFPLQSADGRLLLALATFGVGFLVRPLGGFLIGRMGDTRGRKPAMLLSFWLAGVSIVGLALTPSYASIGLAAPALVVIFRLVQGFALGGEVGPASAFLMEAAPPSRRGLYVALQFSTQWFGPLVAGIVGLILTSLLTNGELTQWGWRVAFMVGALVVPFGLFVRRHLPETLPPRDETPGRAKVQWGVIIRGLFMMLAATIATYTLQYLTTFATHTLGLVPSIAFGGAAICGLCGTLFTLLGGYLADRLGRKPVMITAATLLAGLIAFFPVLTSTMLGLKSTDFNLMDLARLYGASRWQTLWKVQLPSTLPYLLSGMKTGGVIALIGEVTAEFAAGSGTASGLAWRITESSNRLEIATTFAAVALLAILGVAIFSALSLLEWLLLRRWHESAIVARD